MPSGGVFNGIMPVTCRDYVCTGCGYHEECIVEKEALEKIAEMGAAEKRGWQQMQVS